MSWTFYGRSSEVDSLRTVANRGRWFFLRISGRRRIGKTTLVRQALLNRPAAFAARPTSPPIYLQIPDSDPTGVVTTARDFLELFGVNDALPVSLRGLATTIGRLAERGHVVILDEFQYFHRKALFEFTSQLQAEVDRLAAKADRVPGGLIVLGSLHTEMTALLEDRDAPLYQRVTDSIELGHLEPAALLEMLEAHADASPRRLLFLWNLFEGVPKFFRDCHEHGALAADRRTLLAKMFFSDASPLRHEAAHWFLGELRGRYDLILKYIARRPGSTNAELLNHVRAVEPGHEAQIGGYLKVLDEKYRMVDRLQPIFGKPSTRKARFYVRDNFLRAWLAALQLPVASQQFRPIEELLDLADARLADAEGHGLERLAALLYSERSRLRLSDFRLTRRIEGYWDRGDTEIDLVAADEESRRLRFCTVKRSSEKLVDSLPVLRGHVARFLERMPRFRTWRHEFAAIAPQLDAAARRAIASAGFLAEDLGDLTRGMGKTAAR